MKELKITAPVEISDIDKLKSEAYDKIMADKIVRKFIKEHDIPLSFLTDNLGLFLRMVEENEPCCNCKGYQFCKKVNLQKGYLTFVDSDETIYYEKCKYYKQFLEKADLYLRRDFEEDKIFLNYDSNDVKDPASKSMYYIIIDCIIKKQNLYVSSKENMDTLTDLIISAVNKTIDKKKVAFVNAVNLKDEVERYNRYDQDKLFKLKEELFNCDILVIDSLGSENNSEFFKYSFLIDLITYRNTHHLNTIISSYFNLDALEEVYGGYNMRNKTKLLMDKIKENFQIKEFQTILRR